MSQRRPHHDDIPGYSWGYGTYGQEPMPSKRRMVTGIPDLLGYALSALLASGILGGCYGFTLWLAVLLGNETDLWNVDLNILVAWGFGMLIYAFVTVLAAHRKAMFSD